MDLLLDTAPCGFLSFTDDGIVHAANATLLEWLGYAAAGLNGRSVETLLTLSSRIFYQTHFFPLLKIASEAEEVYMTLLTASADELPVLVHAVRRERDGTRVNDCIFMVVRQRSRYEDEILHARRTAEEARSWLSTTLQSIGDAVIATDVQGNIVFANPVSEELTGWRQEEALGRPLDEVFVIVNEETGLPVESPVLRVLREKRVVGLANHTLLIARDGARRPIDDSGAPIRSSTGESLGVVLVFRDITERRQTEQALQKHQAEIEALNERLQRAITETHHRVKNNLQVISALVDMQVGAGTDTVPTSELARMGQHIRGLATIHDLLTLKARKSGQAETLSVRDTMDKLFPLLQGITNGRHLQLNIHTDVLLPIRQATSLAVLANELVSNATKHGKGEIGIAFDIVENRGILEVWDQGPGFPEGFDPNQAAHTGLELIDSVGRLDLRGKVHFTNKSGGGACVRIDFPIMALED